MCVHIILCVCVHVHDLVCVCFARLCMKMLTFERFVCLYATDLYIGICALFVFH